MALESYLDSGHQGTVQPMVPSWVVGGLTNSSSSSGIFFQGDGQRQAVVNSHLSPYFGNSTNSILGTGQSNLVPVSGDMSNAVLNSVTNSSGPSVGASSLVTDANSAHSGGPLLQRSSSINTDPYMRLPASPMSFSSNNISISGSSVMDGSPIVQQNSHQDQNSQQVHQGQQQQQQGASSATSLPTSQMGEVSIPNGPFLPGSLIQEPNHLSQIHKKPCLDMKQEDVLQQQVIQQLLQRQDYMQWHRQNPQLQALIQQQRLRQRQQQVLQSLPQFQRAQLQQQQQQQQQLQLRQQLQQQGVQAASVMKRSFDAGVCTRRLMQYLYHQSQRPPDNSIVYWRKFVAEYFSPRAKKRWCLSMYDNVGHHALGVFPQAAMDAWHCDICNAKPGRGFEATFEVLPRLNEIKFSSGVIDELLFLDLPREFRFPSGKMVLEYAKAVQENVHEQLRVIREGQLRITFTPDLKILSWEFCARRHEELLPRRLLAPQVSQLVQAAHKCQSTIADGGSDGVSQQDLQSNSNTLLAAGHQLAKTMELQSLNDLGFTKRYVRCLQISEVVNSMKDLIDFCKDHKAGPIEGLKAYPQHASAAKLHTQKMQETEQLAGVQGLPTDRNTINKLIAMGTNNNHVAGIGPLSGSAQAALALTNYQNMLMRQNSMNSNSNLLQPETLSPFTISRQSPSSSYQGQSPLIRGSMPSLPISDYSSTRLQTQQNQQPSQQPPPQQPPQQYSSSANNGHLQASQGSPSMQQHRIQQLLQDMTNTTGRTAVQRLSLPGQTLNGGIASNGVTFGNTLMASAASPSVPGSGGGGPGLRSNSFKAASNSDSSAAAGCTNGFNHKAQDLSSQNLQLSDELVQDIAHEFTDNGFFNGDIDDAWVMVGRDD